MSRNRDLTIWGHLYRLYFVFFLREIGACCACYTSIGWIFVKLSLWLKCYGCLNSSYNLLLVHPSKLAVGILQYLSWQYILYILVLNPTFQPTSHSPPPLRYSNLYMPTCRPPSASRRCQVYGNSWNFTRPPSSRYPVPWLPDWRHFSVTWGLPHQVQSSYVCWWCHVLCYIFTLNQWHIST